MVVASDDEVDEEAEAVAGCMRAVSSGFLSNMLKGPFPTRSLSGPVCLLISTRHSSTSRRTISSEPVPRARHAFRSGVEKYREDG